MKAPTTQVFVLLLSLLSIIAQGSAQKRSDADVVAAVVPELQSKTRVPLKLPTYLGDEQTEEFPLYAIVEEATPSRYFVQIAFSPDCSGGTACRWGGTTGKRIGPKTRRPTGKELKLSRGITGYFVDSTCGANCSDSVLTWDQGGYRYTVESKAASADFLTKVANSAIAYTVRAKPDNPSSGSGETFTTIEEFLKTARPKSGEELVSANGDLNGDGVADWAGAIPRTKKGDTAVDTLQIYVLIRQGANGPYRLEVTNGERETGRSGCCWVEDVRIENSSLYIQHNAKTHGTMETATHQFKIYKGAWRLVGVRIFYLDVDADTSTETDTNVLTGRVVVTKQKGDKRTGVRTLWKKISPAYLKDYDYDHAFGTR